MKKFTVENNKKYIKRDKTTAEIIDFLKPVISFPLYVNFTFCPLVWDESENSI